MPLDALRLSHQRRCQPPLPRRRRLVPRFWSRLLAEALGALASSGWVAVSSPRSRAIATASARLAARKRRKMPEACRGADESEVLALGRQRTPARLLHGVGCWILFGQRFGRSPNALGHCCTGSPCGLHARHESLRRLDDRKDHAPRGGGRKKRLEPSRCDAHDWAGAFGWDARLACCRRGSCLRLSLNRTFGIGGLRVDVHGRGVRSEVLPGLS